MNYFTILHVRIVAVSIYVSILHQVWCCKSTYEAKPGVVQGHMKFALAWRPWMLSMGMEMVVAVIVVVIEVVVIVVVVVVVVAVIVLAALRR